MEGLFSLYFSVAFLHGFFNLKDAEIKDLNSFCVNTLPFPSI